MNDDLVFMQDNASIHTAQKVKDWFREQRVRTTDWPPYSPDLNPIENAWHAMKCLALKMFPEIMNSGGTSEEDIEQVDECLKAAWIALPNSLFEGYIESMERRVKMCIQAGGGILSTRSQILGFWSWQCFSYYIDASFCLLV
jgi:hypothetical protein